MAHRDFEKPSLMDEKTALRVYPERQFEPIIPIGTGVHPFGYVPIF